MQDFIQEYRVLSKLSGMCYFVDFDNKKYIFLGGWCVPHHIGATIFLWVMTGGMAYKATANKILPSNEIALLNPHDTDLYQLATANKSSAVIEYLFHKFSTIMREWKAEDYECMIEQTLEPVHTHPVD
jgi:aromatic ring-cleaving dioxygenase